MYPAITVLIVVIVILILWLALWRNAIVYKPDFEMHGHAEEQPSHEAEGQ